MTNTRRQGADAEREIIHHYQSLGYKTFNPQETQFSARLPFGDFLAYNEWEILLVEAKKSRKAISSFAEVAREAKAVDKSPFLMELCYKDEGEFKRLYWDGDSKWLTYD